MLQGIETNGLVLAVIAVAVLLVAWWLLGRASKTRQRSHRPDVLDPGVAPAQRNQALIDAAPAVEVPPVIPAPAGEMFGGLGEIIAAATHEEVVEAAPEAPAPAPAVAASAEGDDLSRIKGLGPKLKTMLAGLGVTSFAQIASWSDEDLARIDAQLGTFAGRPARDSWIEQAKLLVTGDVAAYEAKFGKV